ncbi:hypothetical protein [Actinorugispora endophytica]|uniref:DUF4190 domain-containing protein n=1 Tax=Actinorugispora endophytica TaxID=1605990 RepID=A0A4R6V5L9_9ACTN|nr:hypothetical protein [Actinorugispora endophytica]TDQ51484.1 hypothetical protein EV190_11188 [Actinorugispora endophytica]
MTENGGGPDRPPYGGQERSREEAGSWFKPSGDRNRTQADYRDPYEDRQEGTDDLTREDSGDYHSLSSSPTYPNTGSYPGFDGYRGGAPEMAEPYPAALGDLGAPEAAPSAPASDGYPFDLPPRDTGGPYGAERTGDAAPDPLTPVGGGDDDERLSGSPYDLSSGSYRPEELYAPAADDPGVSFAQGATYRLDPPAVDAPAVAEPAEPGYDFDAPLTYEPKSPHLSDSGPQASTGYGADAPAAREPEWTAPAEGGSAAYDFDAPLSYGSESSAAPDRPSDQGARSADSYEWPGAPAAETGGTEPSTGLGEPYTPSADGLDAPSTGAGATGTEEDGPRRQDPMSVYRIPSGGNPASSLGADLSVPPYKLSPSGGYPGWGGGREEAGSAPAGYDTPGGLGEPAAGSEPEPGAATAGLGGSLGTGSGDTWAFSRDDPRLPDSVREVAERATQRRAEERTASSDPLLGGASPEPEWAAETPAAPADRWDGASGYTGAPERSEDVDSWLRKDEAPAEPAPPAVGDPLLAIANEQAQARAQEETAQDGADDWREDGGYDGAGEGTLAMPVLGADPGGQAPRDEPGYDFGTPSYPDRTAEGGRVDDSGYDELGYPVDRGPSAARPDRDAGFAYDELGYDDRTGYDRGADGQGRDERPGTDAGAGYDELGYDDRGPAGRPYGGLDPVEDPDPRTGVGFADEPGYADPPVRGEPYDDLDRDDREDRGEPRFESGEETLAVPSQGDERPGYGPGAASYDTSYDDEVFAEDDAARGRERPAGSDDYDDDVDDRYYPEPLPDNRARSRRMDKISKEFPGFSGPLGGDPDSDYPGYDNIDVWPETEGLATATVWLGGASLIPGLGLVLAVVALVLGPKARRNIRESRGGLEGEQLVKAGTVLAYVGIVVSVATLVGYFLFWG